MSLWVQRTSTGKGTLVHQSSQTDGHGSCTVPIGFSSAGNITATAWAPDNQVTGPVLSINTWTHIATTYSPTNGLRLYVNGTSVGGTGAQSNAPPSEVVILTLGNSLRGGECNSQSIATGTFSGYLDEFRVYSRELSATEVAVLSKDKTCFDGIMDGDETDIDCGGSCLTCAVGQKCTLTKDCNNVLCTNDICANPTCTDGIQNQKETDVDCGGSACTKRCSLHQGCLSNTDCTTDYCDTTAKKCEGVPYANGTYSFWPMEKNAVDIISGLNGKSMNSPKYKRPGITGSGYALKLIRESRQYITISTFKSFVNTSFTVEMWIYPTTLIDGFYYYGLFAQYDPESAGRSVQMMIRGLQLILDDYIDGVTGTTSLTAKTWYHVAFVYDYPSKTQTIYLNGYQDASRILDQLYLDTSGSINIGMYRNGHRYHYFDG
ncbi:unnamed protein product [Adineta steineri]|uniref:LamG-like jellyroll fold domain-containing protein n=1 Tax=Adineta steineri TaxID=433720 RepID=A0A819WGR8_9BILA|nr:unnamed protein product [Adineta steineri]